MPESHTAVNPLNGLIDFWALIIGAGLVWSKALLGIGMAGFIITAFIHGYQSGVRWKGPHIKVFLFPTLIFLITLLSVFNSSDLAVWGSFLMKKLPFLLLPIAFYLVRQKIHDRHYDYLLGFAILVGMVSMGVLTNYLMHFESVNDQIGRGKAISTPIDHTEYSIYVAYAAIICLFMYLEPRRVVRIASKSSLLLLALFLIIFIHILAVRSGLAVFYITAFLLMGRHLFRMRKFKWMAVVVALALIIPMTAVTVLPSLKKKMDYTKWDRLQFKKDSGLSYSDSERLYSLQAGWAIFKSSPFVGIGVGDLKQACQNSYQKRLGKTLDHYPHNQYLFALASVGILGLLFYLVALVGPLIYFRNLYDPYFLTLHAVILLSGLVENTLERTFSIGFYLFFVLTSISYLSIKWGHRKSSSHS